MDETPKHHRLLVRDLSLAVRIGWTEEERRHPQEIRISVRIDFLQAPAAALTDELRDTLCYGELCETLARLSREREYRLIEHLAHTCYLAVKKHAGHRADVGVSVQKVKPPVDNLLGGALFSCGEVLP